jgi:hypothetical protein
MCKHMPFAVFESVSEERMKSSSVHGAFVRVTNHLADIDRPADRFPEWELIQAANRDWVLWLARGGWAVACTENKEGQMERYAYHITEPRWACGRIPIGSRPADRRTDGWLCLLLRVSGVSRAQPRILVPILSPGGMVPYFFFFLKVPRKSQKRFMPWTNSSV